MHRATNDQNGFQFWRSIILLSVVSVLVACGGGATAPGIAINPAATTLLTGTAATGAPMANAAIDLRCQNNATASTTASAAGTWTQSITTANLPCLIEASGASNTTATHFSLATAGSGSMVVANVTPLTSLALARAAGTVIDGAWFDSRSAANIQSLANGISVAVNTLATSLGAASFTLPAGFEPFTQAFVAVSGNGYDDLLELINQAFVSAGVSFQGVLSSYATGGTIPSAAQSGGAPTTPTVGLPSASGTVRISGQADFIPDATGFEVEVDSVGQIAYNFTSQTNQLNVRALVVGYTVGLGYNVSFSDFASRNTYLCLRNCPVTLSTPAGATHPVTLRFEGLVLPRNGGGDGITLTGSVTGDAPGAAWSAADLPGATTSDLTVNGTPMKVVRSIDTVAEGLSPSLRAINLALPDGSALGISQRGSNPFNASFSTITPLTLSNCAAACNVQVNDSPTGTVIFFNNTVIGTTTFSGTVEYSKTTGSLTSNSTTLGGFTPVTSGIESANSTRELSFNSATAPAQAGGLSAVSITVEAGVVTRVIAIKGFIGQAGQCFTTAAPSIGVPSCAGISIAADGRTVTFNNGTLSGGLVLNGTMVAKGP